MRILAIAQGLLARQREAEGLAQRLTLAVFDRSEVVRDRAVVRGHARKRLARQTPSGLPSKHPAAAFEFLDQRRVIGRIDHHRDVVPVLGRRAHQRRSTDVDVLDRFVEAYAAALDRVFKGIEVDHYQVDRLDPVLEPLAGMVLVSAARQDSAVNLGMERLDAPIEHLGRAGKVLDSADLDPGCFQGRRGAAGRDYLDPARRKRPREFAEPRLVRNAEHRPADFYRAGFHLRPPFDKRAARACQPYTASRRKWSGPAGRYR